MEDENFKAILDKAIECADESRLLKFFPLTDKPEKYWNIIKN